MVGIGGGVPPKVRLDDVVVKIPVGQFPGVVQWDLGKAKQSRNLERTGSLNNPPTSLLTTLTALDSKHELIWLQDTNLPGESERDGRDLYRSYQGCCSRNKLNKDLSGRLLCIGIEAAGLTNNFPSIVIRGSCEYADSHKNKDGQEYAAAVAAAFAKKILSFLQPNNVEGEHPVNELLRQG
ncbi:unnamed protein product [Penicillium salamii]|uniref:Nucleoside phosphorylase domain-containing protein n=1 Tax=Penicillium salamii TaxID=1612424 RepID=A0A9W4J163_9EURO|nr:unnamed protein product [Penicillium salamii]CAG8225147.1 unnamed protein product [Penicillium salamii]CAG8289803.1 unnamed protein product [Penicillium salamii]CAG8319239.1 unnamed protein product [Penicillium salamii]CAG8331764.1 unnamed protein product [Penicillium salamii]